MNYNQIFQAGSETIITVGASIVLLLSFMHRRQKISRLKRELKDRIKKQMSLPIELLDGTFTVVDKIGDAFLFVVGTGPAQIEVKILAPRKLFARVEVGGHYCFRYRIKEHKIYFCSKTDNFEASDLSQQEVVKGQIPLKTKLLREILRNPAPSLK